MDKTTNDSFLYQRARERGIGWIKTRNRNDVDCVSNRKYINITTLAGMLHHFTFRAHPS